MSFEAQMWDKVITFEVILHEAERNIIQNYFFNQINLLVKIAHFKDCKRPSIR